MRGQNWWKWFAPIAIAMPRWFYYPEKSECYKLSVMEHFGVINWKKEWYTPLCDVTHQNHMDEKQKKLRGIMKKTHCKPLSGHF